ncbi:PaiB family negative transcriptional regulator [Salegentibacter sp. 24]|uniref:FMN-binding negative transcriptional regulator n=1 Tax=Salegentibacter sp. 24 TaxID=2183986 RepID=UPI00105BA185|nr:FMN-binding negative transcriptional regulator [Salegentibacter sp. 24]TDN95650.1 PaiB family negative transcriptional regulator [Salegentibacter sp. 24]
MYQPTKYKKDDADFIFRFIQHHPFATFILNGVRLLATHIPVLTKGTAKDFRLFSHIANHNEQFEFLKDGTEALLIFQGADGYVSSSWYKEKDISTWDYSAVHLNVKLKKQSRKELEESLRELVARFEKPQKKPLYYQDIPKKMREDHLPLITGFWCEVEKIQGITKLHQGYDKEDIDSITTHLDNQPETQELSNHIKKEHKCT